MGFSCETRWCLLPAPILSCHGAASQPEARRIIGHALATAEALPPAAARPGPSRRRGFADALLGRWDLTVEAAGGAYPSWLEVRLRTERELMGRFVGRVGSARYVSDIDYAAGRRRRCACPCNTRATSTRCVRGRAARRSHRRHDARDRGRATVRFTATRAPALCRRRGREVASRRRRLRTAAISRAGRRAAPSTRAAGACRAACSPRRRRASISSRDATFDDFRLHAELRFPPGSNSGVYLRGRYEVQIQDDAGKALDPLRMGGVYGFIAPSVDCRARGRRVADARRRARRPARHRRLERHDDRRRPRDSRHHGRRARQRRGRAGADHAPGRSRRDRVSQSDDRAPR